MSDKATSTSYSLGTGRRLKLMVGGLIIVLLAGFLIMRVSRWHHDGQLSDAALKDASLSAKTTGRAFEIANYRYDQIFKPLEQLLVAKPAPSAKPALPNAKPALPGAKKPAAAPKP